MSNLQKIFGDEFMKEHFTSVTTAQFSDTFQILLSYGSLRKKKLSDEYNTLKFKTMINNIKTRNWDLTSIANQYGMEAAEQLFKEGIQVTYGKFPQTFPHIQPTHNQYPTMAEKYTGYPIIHLQKVRNIPNAEFYNSFDIMYWANLKTHIFSDTLNGELCRSGDAEREYTLAPPGCWWIQPIHLFSAAKTKPSANLDADVILQVISSSTFNSLTPSI